MRLTLLLLVLTIFPMRGIGEENEKCPLMTDTEVDPDCAVEFEGERVGLCCAKCAKIWAKNPKYIIKAALDDLPQFQGKEAALGLADVKLLDQRFCPILTTARVTPESPSVLYRGKKVYFFDDKAKARWEADPDACAARATAAGLLPQLKPDAPA